jgi:hypothetical protein
VGQNTHLSTWLAVETKQHFALAAIRQGLSESALLKRLVEQMLSVGAEEPVSLLPPIESRDTRLTIRLVHEDRALLRERAAARTMAAATYVSYLIRAHLRQLAPLPERELSALQGAVNQLAILGRNVNTVTRLVQQNTQQPMSLRQDLQAMLRICDGLREHFRGLIRANHRSWEVGHVEADH